MLHFASNLQLKIHETTFEQKRNVNYFVIEQTFKIVNNKIVNNKIVNNKIIDNKIVNNEIVDNVNIVC